jgi:hypothetical protein
MHTSIRARDSDHRCVHYAERKVGVPSVFVPGVHARGTTSGGDGLRQKVGGASPGYGPKVRMVRAFVHGLCWETDTWHRAQ